MTQRGFFVFDKGRSAYERRVGPLSALTRSLAFARFLGQFGLGSILEPVEDAGRLAIAICGSWIFIEADRRLRTHLLHGNVKYRLNKRRNSTEGGCFLLSESNV